MGNTKWIQFTSFRRQQALTQVQWARLVESRSFMCRWSELFCYQLRQYVWGSRQETRLLMRRNTAAKHQETEGSHHTASEDRQLRNVRLPCKLCIVVESRDSAHICRDWVAAKPKRQGLDPGSLKCRACFVAKLQKPKNAEADMAAARKLPGRTAGTYLRLLTRFVRRAPATPHPVQTTQAQLGEQIFGS